MVVLDYQSCSCDPKWINWYENSPGVNGSLSVHLLKTRQSVIVELRSTVYNIRQSRVVPLLNTTGLFGHLFSYALVSVPAHVCMLGTCIIYVSCIRMHTAVENSFKFALLCSCAVRTVYELWRDSKPCKFKNCLHKGEKYN